MWELDYKENWAPKNWCFWAVVLEKTLESPLDCKEIQPVHPKGNHKGSSLVVQMVKCLPAMQKTQIQSLGQEDPLEKEMAPHSSTLAWKILWTEEPGRLPSMESQRVGHDWVTSLYLYFTFNGRTVAEAENSNTLGTWCKELTHWKRPWCWEWLKARREGNGRGWDGWMASPTQWTWVWVNSGSWWWTGRPGVLQSTGLHRIEHDWATELNWTEHLLKKEWNSNLSSPYVQLRIVVLTPISTINSLV